MDEVSTLVNPAALVWGKNDAERHRHVEASVALLNLIWDELQHDGVFALWLGQADLAKAFARAQASPTPANLRVLEDALAANQPRISACVMAYVHIRVRREWHWLVTALREGFTTWVQVSAKGRPKARMVRGYTPTGREPQEAGARYPKGRLRKDVDVKRYVEFWFRLHIQGEKINHICQYRLDSTLLPDGQEWDRGNIKRYAAKAEAWLSLGLTTKNWQELRAQLAPATAQLTQGYVDE